MENTREGDDLDAPSLKAKYYTDYVLAQMTLEMAKLHRAILRNQHHILMVIGNFAGHADVDMTHESNTSTTRSTYIEKNSEK